METKIEVQIRGVSCGPYTPEQIAQLLDSGVVDWNTPASTDHERWRPLRAIAVREGDAPDPAKLPPPTRTPVFKQSKSEAPLGCVIAAFGGLALFIIWMVVQTNKPTSGGGAPSSSENFDAYSTAKDFARRSYRGAQTFGSFEESTITSHGNNNDVALRVRGLNAFGGPVENIIGLEMELNGTTWRLIAIKQQ